MVNLQKAFVEMISIEDAKNVLKIVYRMKLFGEQIEINYSKF